MKGSQIDIITQLINYFLVFDKWRTVWWENILPCVILRDSIFDVI